MNAIGQKTISTILGIFSLLFWSTAFAFSRDLSEQIGFLRSPVLFCLAGGLIACGVFLFHKEKRDYSPRLKAGASRAEPRDCSPNPKMLMAAF